MFRENISPRTLSDKHLIGCPWKLSQVKEFKKLTVEIEKKAYSGDQKKLTVEIEKKFT